MGKKRRRSASSQSAAAADDCGGIDDDDLFALAIPVEAELAPAPSEQRDVVTGCAEGPSDHPAPTKAADGFRDLRLHCRDCGRQFVHFASKQRELAARVSGGPAWWERCATCPELAPSSVPPGI